MNGETAVNITIKGLILASAFMTVGCTQAIARHDFLERGDMRIERVVETARRTCREQQPSQVLPSTGDYERCVLAAVRSAELTAAKR
jgi:hypothetical protein